MASVPGPAPVPPGALAAVLPALSPRGRAGRDKRREPISRAPRDHKRPQTHTHTPPRSHNGHGGIVCAQSINNTAAWSQSTMIVWSWVMAYLLLLGDRLLLEKEEGGKRPFLLSFRMTTRRNKMESSIKKEKEKWRLTVWGNGCAGSAVRGSGGACRCHGNSVCEPQGWVSSPAEEGRR